MLCNESVASGNSVTRIFQEASPVLMTLSSKLTLFVLIAFRQSEITFDFDFPAGKEEFMMMSNKILG